MPLFLKYHLTTIFTIEHSKPSEHKTVHLKRPRPTQTSNEQMFLRQPVFTNILRASRINSKAPLYYIVPSLIWCTRHSFRKTTLIFKEETLKK